MRFVPVLLAVLLFSVSANADFVPGEIVVKFKEGIRAAEVSPSIENLHRKFKIEKIERGIKDILPVSAAEKARPHDLSRIYQIKFPADVDVEQAVREYQKDPAIEFAEPNYIYRAQVEPNDPRYGSQWNFPKIDAPAGWDITTGEGSSVKIAILDTGIDYTHEDLGSKVDLGYDFVNDDNNPIDDNGHGTHVSGIASAVTNNGIGVAGTSWSARLLAVKVLDSGGGGTSLGIANGLNYCLGRGVQIINMSFGDSMSSSTIKAATDNANAAGILLVAAAGNNDSSEPFYPAAYDYIISVAATDQNDLRSVWGTGSASNYGTTVDVCAPGTTILSTYLSNFYLNKNGTSMASPHVAGLAALVLARNPAFSSTQIRSRIINNCDNIDALNPGYAGLLGAGRINVAKALGKPLAGLTAPASGSYHAGTVTISGTAAGSEFDHYILSLGLTTAGTLENIFTGATAVTAGTLYQLNSTSYADGFYRLKLEAVSTGSQTTEATVDFHIDNTAPTAEVASPAEGAAVSGNIPINGTASDAVFSYYMLEYKKTSETSFIRISSSGTAVTANTLGNWNTTGLTGNYALRLTVADLAGNTAIVTRNLIVGAGTSEAQAVVTNRPAASPNPFNPAAQSTAYFAYNLEDNYSTTIYLFNLSGNLVWQKSFGAGEQGGKAGANLAPWNGLNLFGEMVEGGVYLFKIVAQSGGSKKVIGSGKIIILR
ncbi:S8 family serine peptidase [Candidatus Saganbacteria bacterium]|nr:S8 family serine peptidase [Candidatus Saganbacteria bacterium]